MSETSPRGVLSRLSLAALCAALCVTSGCAAKTASIPAPGAPRYPDFLFPTPPQGLADPTIIVRHEQAWNLLQAGDLRRSEHEFSAVLKRAPAFYPAEAGLGYVELARRDQREAVERFDRALQGSDLYLPALIGRGQALLALRREGEALRSFEAALTIDPSLSEVRARVEVLKFREVQEGLAAARRASDAGRFDEAKQAYTRAISASPDSAFLYRELGLIERRQGDPERALEYFRRAVALDPADARSQMQIGEMLEASGDLDAAIEAYAAAAASEPSESLEKRIETLRSRLAFDRRPAEYRAIMSVPEITRGELAALIGIRLESLVQSARRREAAVITDTRAHWAASWILAVARAGIMEVYANHTFQPRSPARRGELAQAAGRILNLIGARRPAAARQWQGARRKIADVAPGHLSYPAVSLTVAAGVLLLLEGDTFQLTRPVSGTEAVEAIDRLAALADGAANGGPSIR